MFIGGFSDINVWILYKDIYRATMIIHIVGPPGAGKTTLGKRLSKLKNTVALDTDDIDDPTKVEAMEKYKPKTKSDWKRLDKIIAANNREELEDFLEKNKNKNIIFVGFLHDGMDFLKKLIDKKYSIKIDPETLWKQYNLRTLEYLHNNYAEIKRIFAKDDLPIELRHKLVSNKFAIRFGFDCNGPDWFVKEIKKLKERDKKEGYVYKTSDDIYEAITRLY